MIYHLYYTHITGDRHVTFDNLDDFYNALGDVKDDEHVIRSTIKFSHS